MHPIRMFVAWALGGIAADPKTSVPALAALVKDANPQVRKNAAWALGRFGPDGKEGEAALKRALEDSEPAVAGMAGDSLERLAGKVPRDAPEPEVPAGNLPPGLYHGAGELTVTVTR